MYGDTGRALGKYRLIAEIARGGMGIVYLAMVQGPGGFNKLVVVKELKPDLVEEAAFLQMFLDEAKLAARLNHPNIVQTNEVGNDGDRYFMAMDYLDGRGLDRVRRRARTAGWGLSLPMHLRVTCDMLAGLEYAHKLADFDGTPLGIVHRDISPQNVFITFDGQVKLLDFGIAKTVDSTNETKVGVLKGKVSYMAPEQARGAKVDARADVFSAGVMLWEALTGRKMRQGQSEQETMKALIAGDLPRVSTVKPWIPTELDEICARALAPEPGERYQSAGEFRDALEHHLTSSNANVSARDVGTCISELFREDRASINTLIESHIARSRNESARDDLPIIELSYEPHSGNMNTPLPTAPLKTFSAPQVPTLDNHSANTVSAAPSATISEARGRSSKALIGAALAIGAVGVAAGVYFSRAHDAPAATPVAALDTRDNAHVQGAMPPTATSPATSAAVDSHAPPIAPTPVPPVPVEPTPTAVDVDIRVTPANASVTIDDINLPANPFHHKYLSDSAVHHVRAVAPGYAAKVADVVFNANVTLDFSLARVAIAAAPAARQAPRPQVAATPASPTAETPRPTPPAITAEPRAATPVETKPAKPAAPEINPAGGIKPRRPIDATNPYGAK